MGSNNRVCAFINLENVVYNMENMHNAINKDCKMMAVIKTDGYGHGAVAIAHKIDSLPYLYGYAVATIEEAVELRVSGINKDILVLGFVFPQDYETAIIYDISLAIFKEDAAIELSQIASKLKKTAKIHIKVDTGMGRIGFKVNANSYETVNTINSLEGLKIEGVFTHFAKADMTDHTPTFIQIEKFKEFISGCENKGIVFPLKHCSNSAGIIDFEQANFDMVRAGITLYGLMPSDEVSKNKISLKPLMSIKSHIAFIKEVDAGTQISYGGTYTCESKKLIATIPVGYGDGYPRSLSNKGYVLIRGQKAYITGRVCMDQFMVDVTHIRGVSDFDEVTLVGKDGNESITLEMLGDLSGRFNYELACDINKRVPRIYA